jgi:hypothetical protein
VSIELTESVEEQPVISLQSTAAMCALAEALRQYLESAAVTDLEPTQIAEARAALLG